MINLLTGLLLITEVMADPSPPCALPEYEYLELYNPGTEALDLHGYRIRAGGRETIICQGGDPCVIEPNGYLILSSEKAAPSFEPLGAVLALAPWPSLSNSGFDLVITDPLGFLVFSMNYHPDLYDDALKAAGGWSLEMADLSQWGHPRVYHESNDSAGGTPGRAGHFNLVLSERDQVGAVRLFPLSDGRIGLLFSGLLHPASIDSSDGLTLYPGGIKCRVDPTGLTSLAMLAFMPERPPEEGLRYKVRIEGGFFDDGYRSVTTDPLLFALPEAPVPGDIVISEVLFEADTTGFEFIEVYNRSDKVIDPGGLTVVRGSYETPGVVGDWSDEQGIPFLLFPSEYAVLTSRVPPDTPASGTFRSSMVLRPDLPTLPNAGAWLALQDARAVVFDEMLYIPEMHDPLLKTGKGISLERIDLNAPGIDPLNWYSSADPFGSTPGRTNSQGAMIRELGADTVAPARVNIRMEEQGNRILVSYKTDQLGWFGRFLVFDRHGSLVKVLRSETLLGTQGVISWYGYNEKSVMMPPGIYLIMAEYQHPDGHRGRWRRACYYSGADE